MKKGILIIIAVLVLALAVILPFIGTYNTMATLREDVSRSFSNVQTQYQRRADLIPNLVETVKGYSEHEKDLLTAVTLARAGIVSAENPAELQNAASALDVALENINITVESYPDLKADAAYISLMDELAGSENRINVARQDYNTVVGTYNSQIIRFPAVIAASVFGFEKSEYFQGTEGSENAPKVDF